MGRVRKKITLNRLAHKGDKFFCYLKHPIRGKTICFSLGTAGQVTRNLDALNTIYLNEEHWHKCPADTPNRIREQWEGPDGVLNLYGRGDVQRGKRPLATDAESSAEVMAAMQAEIDALNAQIETLLRKVETQGTELESLRGAKYVKGAAMTLREATDSVIALLTERKHDQEHIKAFRLQCEKFIRKFGAATKCNSFDGRESEINSYIRSIRKRDGTPVGPASRMFLAVYIPKMLRAGGATIITKAIENVGKKELQAARGRIKCVTRDEAKAILNNLAEPYRDMWLLQCRIGLRCFEALTLHRSNFTDDFSDLELKPLGHLTLKTGPRRNAIPIPSDVRAMLATRAAANPIIFPEPRGAFNKRKPLKTPKDVKKRKRCGPAEGGKPWRNPAHFAVRYKTALENAAAAADIKKPMDGRTGRRTCATLLLNDGVPIAAIAELLGNSPAQIISSYGDPNIRKLPLGATEIS